MSASPGLAHIRTLLRHNPLIRKQIEQHDRNRALLVRVQDALPRPLGAHCRDAVLEAGVLTLFVDSSVWVTRARFTAETLARALADLGVSEVKARVRIERQEGGRRGRSVGTAGRALSREAARHLFMAAEATPDPALASALRRLATSTLPTADADGQ